MQAIILVHGIMGSKLKLGTEEIWPPSLGELLQNHYTRIAKLRDPRAAPTDILYQYTSFYQIYGPIARELDAILAVQGGRRPNFWFDWRVDLLKSVDVLAQAIADTCSGPNPADKVAIVAHSMGGLVARLLLESGNTTERPGSRTSESSLPFAFPRSAPPSPSPGRWASKARPRSRPTT